MSLRNISKLAMVKYGVNKTELPKDLIKEVKEMEDIVKAEMSGSFSNLTLNYSYCLKIEWSPGEWQFVLTTNFHWTPEDWKPTLRTIKMKIRAGRREHLGFAGGYLFHFPNREVTIDNFKIDLERRKILFLGKCSSVKTQEGRKFRCTLQFEKIYGVGCLTMKSKVISEAGWLKVRIRTLNDLPVSLSLHLPSESDSSIDFDDN